MTSEDKTKFLKEFGLRRDALLERLKKAANVGEGPMSLGKLDILAAASMELLTLALANMPEPTRGERVKGLSATLAADVAQKRKRIEQKIPNRRLDAPRQAPTRGSA
jgi:hypothetical protein